jgi:endoribonuclease LACTB2
VIEATRYNDVLRLRLWTRRSALAGYDVSAFVVRGVLVDTGFPHAWRDLGRALPALDLRGVIVTHWHEDHAGNAPQLAALGKLPLWMAPYTEQKLRERQQVKLYRHVIWGRPLRLAVEFVRFQPEGLDVIAAPGHSPDHHVVFDRETSTLFSADLWLGVRVRVVGRTENPYQIVDSLDAAIALRPHRMFDAHRGLVDKPVVALEAKRSWLRATIDAIERRLDAGHPESVILREVLGGEERTGWITEGEYARRNLVKAVAQHRAR